MMHLNRPKVSVIIPTFGGSSSLIRAIESVISQDYENFEIIVVDDNNPDTESRKKTEHIMNNFVNNNNVIYLKHDQNKNGAAARNTGIYYSQAEYISFLDDDDIYLQGKIKKQVEYLENHREYGACYCWRIQNNVITSSSLTGDLSAQLLDLSFTTTTPALMIRRDCCLSLNGFDITYKRHQDFEFLLRFYRLYSIGVVEEVLVEIKGNDINNQLRGKKLYDLKYNFFAQFGDDVDRINQSKPGYKRHVYAAHFSSACKEFIRYGNFILALKAYFKYGVLGGFLFWKLFFIDSLGGIKRKLWSDM